MECPNGHGPMTRGQEIWFCEECDLRQPRYPAPPESPSPRLAGLDCLPSMLEISLREFEEEGHPVCGCIAGAMPLRSSRRLFTIVSLTELCW